MKTIRRVVCGMSGGVDSAVSALILKKKGYDVLGVFMTNWDQANETGKCSSQQDREDAQYVCHHLQIPFIDVNFVKEYWTNVFSDMIDGYENGLTPNPDVLCNRHIKFGSFFKYATETLGADATATGHYARNSYGNFLENPDPNRGASLLIPEDKWKDQTLFLCQIKQKALQRTMFPIGDLHKDVVRQIARTAGLDPIVKKRESVGICFIGDRSFDKFIEGYIEPKPGNFVDVETGKIIGKHLGTHYWTLGQRALISGQRVAYFIAKLNPVTRDIFVAPGTKHPALFTTSLVTETPHWINSQPNDFNTCSQFPCKFRFQHVHPLMDCTIQQKDNGELDIELEFPLRAITAGQFAVFYRDNECIGSAKIICAGPSLYELNINHDIDLKSEFS